MVRSAALPDLPKAIRIFLCSCGHPQSERFCDELEEHLALLKRQEMVEVQQSHKILAGLVRKDKIVDCVYSADIIVLFISKYLFSSNEYWDIMVLAMELRGAGKVRVVPVLASPVDYEAAKPIENLQVLPRSKKFLSQMSKRDEAYVEIVKEIRGVIREIRACVDREEGLAKEGIDGQSDVDHCACNKASGDMFPELQEFDKAMATYNEANSSDPGSPDAYQARARVYRILALLYYKMLKQLSEETDPPDDTEEGLDR